MFYFLSKILDLFLSPLAWSMALVAAAALTRRRPRVTGGLTLSAFILLYSFSSEPLSNALFRSLEPAPQSPIRDDVTYDTVIVLGGIVEDRAEAASARPAYNDNVERLPFAYDLLRTGRAKTAVLSGGAVDETRTDVIEARALAAQLIAWGIAADRVIIEDKSRNTRENAIECARIVRERGFQRVLMVTSAFHMPRAIGCFNAVGLSVDTYAVDYRSYDPAVFSGSWIPRPAHLQRSDSAIREYAGRLVYRVSGYYSAELVPRLPGG